MSRPAGWYAIYALSTLCGLVVYAFLVIAAPLTGQWPRSFPLIFTTARGHADRYALKES